jgi:hypothetical protein
MTSCIPRAVGVPGLIHQPPTWPGIEGQTGTVPWNVVPPPTTTVPPGLDDPRWQGALRIGHPAAMSGGEAATFRCVYHDAGSQKSLFLSWHVRADTSVDAGEDVVWVGFERAAGNPLLVKIEPFDSGVAKASGPIALAAAYDMDIATSTGTAMANPPNWINANTRAWFDPGTNRWAVQMRVPVSAADGDAGVNLGETFRMWYEMTVVCPDSTCIPHSWPYGSPAVTEPGFPPQPLVPALSTWDTFHPSTGAADPVCPTTGFVSLGLMDVGTTSSPSSKIDLNAENTFIARPENKTGAQIPAGAISAFFRIANWGSVADPNAPWDPVPATGGTTNPAQNSAAIVNGAKGSNTFKWTLSSGEQSQFQPAGSKPRHQCILVELSGGGITFQPSSVWQNMDFGTASRFERSAEINSVGLGQLPGGEPERDTFLLVEKLNMPAGGPSETSPPEQPRLPADPEGPREGTRDEEALRLLRRAEPVATPSERLDAQKPTYRVHVCHDTGKTVVRNGRTLRVLAPGTSFGYYVEHDGAGAKWSDEIDGATRISKRFYRLKVPVEGVAHVTTVIEAHDARPGGWLEWILRLLRRIWRFLKKLFGG